MCCISCFGLSCIRRDTRLHGSFLCAEEFQTELTSYIAVITFFSRFNFADDVDVRVMAQKLIATMKHLPLQYTQIILLTLYLFGRCDVCKCFVPITTQVQNNQLIRCMTDEETQNEVKEVTTITSIDESNTPLSMPLAGGPSLIFAMAQRMLIWDDNEIPADTPTQAKRRTLPRWHPHAGISDTNPSFRSTSPKMNSFGYSAAIRRNSRKRSPTLQRYALKVYNERFKDSGLPKSIMHYEGALVASSKLGLWVDALDILKDVEFVMKEGKGASCDVHVNEAMVMALVKACVRGSKRDKSLSLKDKRKPLDVAREFLNSIEVRLYSLRYQNISLHFCSYLGKI